MCFRVALCRLQSPRRTRTATQRDWETLAMPTTAGTRSSGSCMARLSNVPPRRRLLVFSECRYIHDCCLAGRPFLTRRATVTYFATLWREHMQCQMDICAGGSNRYLSFTKQEGVGSTRPLISWLLLFLYVDPPAVFYSSATVTLLRATGLCS